MAAIPVNFPDARAAGHLGSLFWGICVRKNVRKNPSLLHTTLPHTIEAMNLPYQSQSWPDTQEFPTKHPPPDWS